LHWRVIVLLLLVLASAPNAFAASSGDGERLLGPDGAPLFVSGINYEGPADRAWQMWDNDKFDAAAIDADFARASKGGFNVIRLFVQAPLAVDLAQNRFSRLDQVVDSAERQHVQLILSLHDYGERDLARISATAQQLADHYKGRAGVLAFDLKNEPRFGDLALAKYGAPPPLQQHGLIDAFGERLARGDVGGYRASDDGKQTVPSYLSDDEAYIYVNNLRLYREMLAEASTWVRDHNYQGTTLDFLDDPAGKKWAPFVSALNATLQAWIAPQLQAVKKADPNRPVTVDHVDAVLAKLPANDALDFQSLHRYPATGGASIRANLNLIKSIEAAHPGKPYLLSEFGYATDSLDPTKAALAETAIYLGLLSQHAAGGAKWMLNDTPPGFNQRERTLGAFKVDASAKPIVAAIGALGSYLSASGAAPGDFTLADDADAGVKFTYRASDALLLGGKAVDAGEASFTAGGPAQLFVTWTEPGVVRLWASAPMQVKLDLPKLVGSGSVTQMQVDAGAREVRVAPPPSRGADYAISGGRFFSQTNGRKDSPSGFSVTDADGVPLWTAFQALCGGDVLGYPVSRRFTLDGFVVQAFQKAVLQWHPESKSFAFLNTFDVLHDRGRDDWLEVSRQTPRPLDNAPDAGLSWDKIVARHVALLDKAPPPLKERFLADPQWLDHYGLPVAVQEWSNSVVVRAQRATLQYWKEAVPWAAKGSVSVANGGDLAKESGIFPWLAVTPENAPR
jgi:hypothetical protein